MRSPTTTTSSNRRQYHTVTRLLQYIIAIFVHIGISVYEFNRCWSIIRSMQLDINFIIIVERTICHLRLGYSTRIVG